MISEELVQYITAPDLRIYLTNDEFKSVAYYLEAAGHSKNYQALFEGFNRAAHQPSDKTIMQTLGQYLRHDGMQQGMKQGIQEGIEQMKRKHILKMNTKHYTHREIAEIMDLSEAEVLRYLEAITD